MKANGCRLSLLALKELLNMRDTDTLAISPGGEGELPVLPVLESNEIYAASETSLPEFRAMELREKASRKSLAIASGTFSPSIKRNSASIPVTTTRNGMTWVRSSRSKTS